MQNRCLCFVHVRCDETVQTEWVSRQGNQFWRLACADSPASFRCTWCKEAIALGVILFLGRLRSGPRSLPVVLVIWQPEAQQGSVL